MSLLDRHSAALSGVCLFHSTPNADSSERRQVREKVIGFVIENGVAPFIDTFVPGLFFDKKNAAIEPTRKRALATSQAALVGYAKAMRDRPSRLQLLAQSPVPVLLIGGDGDTLIPISDLQRIAEKSPKCEFHELKDVAHMGMFEAKNQCQSIISRFAAHLWPNKGI